jgi:DNA-binding transcriptional ArsR family regulator
MPHRAGRSELKPAQRLALAALNDGKTQELTREEYQQLAGVSRSQAAYDLAELVEGGVVERVGGGRSTRYRLARRSQPSQRHWTNERIRGALVEFCAGRKTWPSAADFKTAGHTDLYVAASRYGGIGFWASELGFSRPARAARPQRPVRSIRPMLRSAAAGAAVAGVLFGAAGALLYPWHRTPTREATGKPHTRTGGVAPRARVHTAGTRPKQARKPRQRTPSSSPSVRWQALGNQSELAAQRFSARVASSPARRQESTPQSTGSAAPSPLPAPSGGGQSAPAPLPPPRR